MFSKTRDIYMTQIVKVVSGKSKVLLTRFKLILNKHRNIINNVCCTTRWIDSKF